ncbi:SDR family oxidoreductase [Intrasporangium sp. DVR]|uniref:SDR family oxidoreductase n=1 Tax=Intrasporangium sp. DVR TaxID=3127867 RepID=UPI003340A843
MTVPARPDRPVAVVTGGTRGIGRAIAEDLAPRHHVVIGGRSEESVDRVAQGLPSAEGFVADLRDCGPGGSLDSALRGLVERLPRVGVLVHSAGVLHRGRIADLSVDDWDTAMRVNLIAVAAITRALLPALRAAHGLVVAINSGAGLTSAPTMGPYSASKFALRAFTDALREEERSSGVRVTSIHPGRVDTDMQQEMIDFEGGSYRPDDYLRVESVVRAVRLAVDATDEACIDQVSVRPRGFPG